MQVLHLVVNTTVAPKKPQIHDLRYLQLSKYVHMYIHVCIVCNMIDIIADFVTNTNGAADLICCIDTTNTEARESRERS